MIKPQRVKVQLNFIYVNKKPSLQDENRKSRRGNKNVITSFQFVTLKSIWWHVSPVVKNRLWNIHMSTITLLHKCREGERHLYLSDDEVNTNRCVYAWCRLYTGIYFNGCKDISGCGSFLVYPDCVLTLKNCTRLRSVGWTFFSIHCFHKISLFLENRKFKKLVGEC